MGFYKPPQVAEQGVKASAIHEYVPIVVKAKFSEVPIEYSYSIPGFDSWYKTTMYRASEIGPRARILSGAKKECGFLS